MNPLLLWTLLCVLLFLVTAGLVLAGILKQRVNYIILATAFFLVLVGCGVYTGFLFAGKAVQKVSKLLTPRSGYEAYTALFGEPIDSSVHVLSLQDQLVPRIDVAIRMEVTCSAQEFKRIIQQNQYHSITFDKTAMQAFDSAPAWFVPTKLKGKVTLFSTTASVDGDVQHLYVSEDSTHLFIEDIAD